MIALFLETLTALADNHVALFPAFTHLRTLCRVAWTLPIFRTRALALAVTLARGSLELPPPGEEKTQQNSSKENSSDNVSGTWLTWLFEFITVDLPDIAKLANADAKDQVILRQVRELSYRAS